MALVISAVQVTGTATAYTVPANKIAKVRVVSMYMLADAMVSIGNYDAVNYTGNYVSSKWQSNDTTSTSVIGIPTRGFVRASYEDGKLSGYIMYVKEDHVLVAGETVSATNAATVMSYTIFEEDA